MANARQRRRDPLGARRKGEGAAARGEGMKLGRERNTAEQKLYDEEGVK